MFLRSIRQRTKHFWKLGRQNTRSFTPSAFRGSKQKVPPSSQWISSQALPRSSVAHTLNPTSHEEAHEASAVSENCSSEWKKNLRGGEENSWLIGPRDPEKWYTGKKPVHGICPGVASDGKIRSLPLPQLNVVTRKSAQEYFDNSWTLMETMFAGLHSEEAFYRPPLHGLRHPQIFYYGHTPCLYINKLRVAGVLQYPINAEYEAIFETGVDEMLWDDIDKNDMLWPTVSEVRDYRREVYKTISDIITNHPSLDDSQGPVLVNWDHPMWSLFMGFEHERIHLETSSVLFRETPLNNVQIPPEWPDVHPSADNKCCTSSPKVGVDYPNNEMLTVKGSQVELGKPRDFPSYGWDNEYGHRLVNVPSFSASKYLVTNGEYWEFVSSGGYRNAEYWSDLGWKWRSFRNMKAPFFWNLDGPQGSHLYKLRTIFEVKDMQWDWPVEVNYHEASAFCVWKDKMSKDDAGRRGKLRVITEAEHHLIRGEDLKLTSIQADPYLDDVLVSSSEEFKGKANLNLAYSSTSPVDSLQPSTTGHHDAMGNAWEWTECHFNPLEGFETHPVYDDFSTPCFDGKHHMITGGSFISTGDEASAFARFSFRPHFLQHSGFRVVSSMDAKELVPCANIVEDLNVVNVPSASIMNPNIESNVYETQTLVDQYLGLHFPSSGVVENIAPILNHSGAPTFALRFPQRVAQLAAKLSGPLKRGRALDIGCAVGGSSFELSALGFQDIVGFDFSQAFVDTAEQMRRKEDVVFQVPIEADISQTVMAVHEVNVGSEECEKITFQKGDACTLSEDFQSGKLGEGKFDVVVMANLLCRLPDPLACLDGLSTCVNSDGIVVMVTPFSWLDQYTEKCNWLGGYVDSTGKTMFSKDRLFDEMQQRGFKKIHEEQMPLVIREHQRKYQYIVSEASAWQRN